ncbi:hypothetical protein R5M92_01035 [Halomonas sp. Bachu 37]|uniref:hypothetical protein n=1 Tax=Halomonas kashgarensis TaxID=3084920 RepID=UPI0032171ED2
MDYSFLYDAAKPLWWTFPALVLLGILKSRWFKGLFGEALVKQLKARFEPSNDRTCPKCGSGMGIRA